MKIRPLPEIDLANIAPLPTEQKRPALEQLHFGFPPLSYAPVRACLPAILNIQAPMFGMLPRVPWDRIAETIHKLSKRGPQEAVANLRVAEGLYHYATVQGLTGRSHEIRAMPLGVTIRVVYWQEMVLSGVGPRPFIPFFDPRRAKFLTTLGKRFVFSVMHERIRALDEDYAEVGLGIYQFARSNEGPRAPILDLDDGVALFSFEELDLMVRDTYEMWREVCLEREAAVRRQASGG